jgi:prepilin-type N-terminal cleavage/methylation domain-containing protein
MKIALNQTKSSKRAFTLIEMIGVLAVIAILAAVLIPKIFNAINNARINSTAESIATVKTAIADHYAKFGTLLSSNGTTITTLPQANFDQVLLTEGYLDKAFVTQLTQSSNTAVWLCNISTLSNQTVTAAANTGQATDWAFDLADTNAVNDINGTAVCAIVLSNVLVADAQSLNNIIDGPALGNSVSTGSDLFGRVKYSTPVSGITTMTIYITHR